MTEKQPLFDKLTKKGWKFIMSKVTEIVEYLTEAQVMYMSTIDGHQPKVRPIGFIMEFEGSAYFTTGKGGPIHKELHANPHFEVATMHPTKPFHRIRFSGKAVFDASTEAFEKYFEKNPNLRGVEGIDLYRVDEWKATIYEGHQDRRTIEQ